jgi:hypothetical protein
MANQIFDGIKHVSWKVDVYDRLTRVEADVNQALSVKGWSLAEHQNAWTVFPQAEQLQDEHDRDLRNQAQAVVTAVFNFIDKTKRSLEPPAKRRRGRGWWRRLLGRQPVPPVPPVPGPQPGQPGQPGKGQPGQGWLQRAWGQLNGQLLMSAYTSLHAAESSRVLLLSAGQLAAAMPVIRQRAAAYLATDDPRRAALDGLNDPTDPTHQALSQVQAALVQNVTAVHAAAHPQQPGQAGPAAGGPTAGGPAAGGPAAGAAAPARQPPAGQPPAGQPPAGQPPAGQPPAGQQQGAAAQGGPAPDPCLTQFTEMLGCDQQIASMVMSEACKAEDQQQSQVRRFRNVLLGTFVCLFIVVVVLGVIGAMHPAYFPLCVAKQGSTTTPPKMICPSGGSIAGTADLPLVLGIGGVGAVLAVARNLAGLKPVGVRYSLSVGQGLVKIAFGAITAMLGIFILSTQTSVGFLGSQVGLLSTAVVFGYSQQLFTKVIDQQANDLLKAASSTS